MKCERPIKNYPPMIKHFFLLCFLSLVLNNLIVMGLVVIFFISLVLGFFEFLDLKVSTFHLI